MKYKSRTSKWRIKLWLEQNGKCWLCGEFVDLRRAHLDHVFPVSIGGTTTFNNLKVAHNKCNSDRTTSSSYWAMVA